MEWVFDDGTVVRLGGEVEGASLLAQRLRQRFANPQLTSQLSRPCPTNWLPVDRMNPLHVNAVIWEVNRGVGKPVLVRGPEIEYPKSTTVPEDDPGEPFFH